ncbi:MAG TPA: decarboxylating 6-phosphogluconate dehydrogenase [Trueperaceae bacterium]|nr:decarboxylating 6-phosphogluconate dehydrogenase [Trueperaceae bacterium]
MHLGMVGLGRMGANMTRRLMRDGHTVVVTDIDEDNIKALADEGATPASSLPELIEALPTPRVVWLMVPSGDATQKVFDEALSHLAQGDLIVDGSNSHYTDTLRRGREADRQGVRLVDAGVSGGVWGLKVGYNIMAGGEDGAFELAEPALKTLAPENGYAHVGPVGAGHFVKMVHNGIEYGLLQAYGEGFEALEAYPGSDLDLHKIAELWTHGAVVRSWLLELLVDAFGDDPELDGIQGYVDDSGMGRWTVDYAVEQAIPLPAITAALYARFASRQEDSFSAKVVAALRNQFGGHPVKEA